MDSKSHYRILEEDSKKGLFRLAVPMVVAFFLQTFFNLVDTYYVGKLGADAIAALGVAFPVQLFIIAIAAGLGVGAQSHIARALGSGNKSDASKIAEHTVVLSLICGIITSIIGIAAIGHIIGLIGATENVFSLSIDYLSVILAGSVFIYMNMMLDSILRGEGDTKRPMIFMGTAAIVNILLDPIFIFTLGLGVQGAAIATILSRCIITIVIIYYILIGKKNHTPVNIRRFTFDIGILKKIIDIGVPASLSQLATSIVMFLFNNVISQFGSSSLATFGIGIRVESLIFMPIIGLSSAYVSAVGYFKGSGQIERIREIYWYAVKMLLALMVLLGTIFFAVPDIIYRIFTDDVSVIEQGIIYFRILVFGYPLIPLSMLSSSGFQGMGRGYPPLVLVMLRSGVVAFPLAFISTYLLGYGLWAVWAAIMIGDVASGFIGNGWFLYHLGNEEKKVAKGL